MCHYGVMMPFQPEHSDVRGARKGQTSEADKREGAVEIRLSSGRKLHGERVYGSMTRI